jgi:Tol biopolymer transport system component
MTDLYLANRRTTICALALLAMVSVLLIAATPTHRAAAIKRTVAMQPNIAAANTNGKIAFTSDRDGNVEIYIMNPDGSGQLRLTNNPAFDGDPAWSPDGTRIVFTSTRDGNEEIYLMNANGTGQTRLTNNSASALNLDRTPAWSPDGSQIAFASNRETGDFDIFTMNADGSAQTSLTSGVLADFQDPDWSPDGTKIACSQSILQNGVRGPYGVLVMNADGTNQTRLTTPGNVDITPRWSPDGSRLVFASTRLGNLGTFQVFVMAANGTNQSRLTNNTGENSRPGWAPDGTKIVFQSTQRFSFDVYTINAGGGNEQQLTNTFAQDAQPVWQPVSTEPFNPIDDPEVFVRRQYLDFLNREPDPVGFAYWVGQITQCGNDQNCINRKRVDVAAAFFIEQEFQQTGFFVYRIYQASLCRRPTFAEFLVDRANLIAGTDLEANKEAFVQDFVGRAEFLQKFPQVMPRDTFIDALIAAVRACSGPDLTSQRSVLVGEYNSSTNQTVSRARVLRVVADNAEFMTAEFNRGFVLSEYFGFLRRDPDQAGFDFWLDVIDNREQGEYLAMVCAFITSAEYQLRFGPVITHSNSECGD